MTDIASEALTVGAIVDDERFPHVVQVGHVVIGTKWVTFRAFHPAARVFPNTPRRVRRGETVRVR